MAVKARSFTRHVLCIGLIMATWYVGGVEDVA